MNFQRSIILFFALVFMASGVKAQDKDSISREMKKFGRVMQRAVDRDEVIGHSAMVYYQGEIAYYEDWGQRDKANGLPIERDTIFRIYSMTKPITSVAAMQLVEAGKIGLDDPVSKYIPSFADLKVLVRGREVAPKREMTVRDLFRHSSGLTYGFSGDTPVHKSYRRNGILITGRNIERMVEKLSTIPLLFHPGERCEYGVSTDVLGRVIEVASEQRLADYFQENIFDPAEMTDTFFTVPKDKRDRFAAMYRPQADGTLVLAPSLLSYRYFNANQFDSGGGGLCSTMDDYLKFCKILLAGGTYNDHQFLKQESLEQMFQNQLEDLKQKPRSFEFGLGFRIYERGDYGWGGIAGTRFWVNPEKDLAVFYMTQINPYGDRTWSKQLLDRVHSALE